MSQTDPDPKLKPVLVPSPARTEPAMLSSTEDEGFLSDPAALEDERRPGLNGEPVGVFEADHSKRYTRIVPFSEKMDSSVEFFYDPRTLTALAGALVALAWVAMSSDVLPEGRSKERLGIYCAIGAFLLFAMLQFRDGPFIRPHPAFWRIVLGVNLLYELALVFLLFQDRESARHLMTHLDSALGVPLPDKSYGDACEFTVQNLWDQIDIFCLAHALGWFGKALILRDYWFCWILSVMFEVCEYSLQHQLANFNECWWDHWIMDVLVCNWLGIYLGIKTCQFFEVKKFSWHGFRASRGIRAKTKRVASQLLPHDWTVFHWHGTRSLRDYVSVVALLTILLAGELNVFYLKTILYMQPEHPIVITRLAMIFLWALPACAEMYQYCSSTSRVKRMGAHMWLLMATVATELLCIRKWSVGLFPAPFPARVKLFWAVFGALLVLYPLVKFGVPALRRKLRRDVKRRRRDGPASRSGSVSPVNGVVVQEEKKKE